MNKKEASKVVFRGKLIDVINSYNITDGNGEGSAVSLYNEIMALYESAEGRSKEQLMGSIVDRIVECGEGK